MIRSLPAYLLASLLLFFVKNAAAQTPNPCGTPAEKSAWLQYYQAHLDEFAQRNDDTSWLYVPMTVHLLGTDDGTGYFPLDKTFSALCELNEDFAPIRIRYFLPQELNFIDNSEWYSHATFGPGGKMMDESNKEDCLNSYIVADPAGNCGYYSPQQDAVALSKGCVGPGDNTWAHELGHNLSLPHPFFGWEGHNNYNYAKPAPTDWDGWPVEKMDGSNCQFAADGFCDTPPDYLNYRWDCASDSYSTKQQHDPDSIPFVSDGSFYMSYSLDQCANRFSNEQAKAMRTNLLTERADLLYTISPVAEIASTTTAEPIAPIDNALVPFNDITLEWQPVAGADFYHVWVSLFNIPTAKFYSELVPAPATSVKVNVSLPNNKAFRWVVVPYSKWDFCAPDSTILGKFTTANIVATNDFERVADVQIVPNPASSVAGSQLLVSSSEAFSAQLDVVDFSGKLLFSRPSVSLFEGENTLHLPINDLPSGVFLVNLKSEKGIISRRLVVMD